MCRCDTDADRQARTGGEKGRRTGGEKRRDLGGLCFVLSFCIGLCCPTPKKEVEEEEEEKEMGLSAWGQSSTRCVHRQCIRAHRRKSMQQE